MDPAQDLNQLTKNPTPSLSDTVEEIEEKQNDFQAMYNAGGHFKEQLEAISKGWDKGPKPTESTIARERAVEQIVEVPQSPELEKHPELAEYVEKVERDPEMQKQLADDYVHQVGMKSATPQSVSVQLPLTQSQVQQGLQRRVYEAVRWLSEWCVRQMKMLSLKRA